MFIENNVFLKDNLSLLKEIESDKIDFIYSDILYGTGRDFSAYKDLNPNRAEIENFYTERFQEMYRCLKSTGSIVLQMDKRINHWIRILLDDIFGYSNFRNEINWCYSGGGITKKKFPEKSDAIIWYSKSNNYFFNPQFISYTGVQKAHPYSKDREYKSQRGKHLEDWWSDVNSFGGSTNSPEKKLYKYPTQKPEALMSRIIDTWTKEGDLVADFFMGSGSFISAAKKMNRSFIGCDNSEVAFKLTTKRLENIDKEKKLDRQEKQQTDILVETLFK